MSVRLACRMECVPCFSLLIPECSACLMLSDEGSKLIINTSLHASSPFGASGDTLHTTMTFTMTTTTPHQLLALSFAT
uniref:Putative secreted peptide n=1 Tax=Anopheles braziliensis TaxID=58242 RepID=A0A2M3ZVC2_9DIPT